MRWLINYFRSCFCRHDWEFITRNAVYLDDSSTRPYKHIYLYRCKKCGYMQKTVLE